MAQTTCVQAALEQLPTLRHAAQVNYLTAREQNLLHFLIETLEYAASTCTINKRTPEITRLANEILHGDGAIPSRH